MAWVEKDTPTPFDGQPIEGLFYLDGDILAEYVGRDWTKGQKFPVIVFPSGEMYDLWESTDPAAGGIVHLFGELDLPLKSTRDEAYEIAAWTAEQVGYQVAKVDDQGLELVGLDSDDHLLVVYDQENGRIGDVRQLESLGAQVPRPMELLPDKIREQLPELYSGEEEGLAAKAVVKYFTPDSNWTWYASEFDGEDIFFGLVSGFEVELGYFSLLELRSVRGPWGLPIERDLYFEATSLQELKERHEQERRGYD